MTNRTCVHCGQECEAERKLGGPDWLCKLCGQWQNEMRCPTCGQKADRQRVARRLADGSVTVADVVAAVLPEVVALVRQTLATPEPETAEGA